MELIQPAGNPSERADALLRPHLSAAQWESYSGTGWFYEGAYRIDTRPNTHGLYGQLGWVCATVIDPSHGVDPTNPFSRVVPPGDIALTLLLLIRTRPELMAGWFSRSRVNVRHPGMGNLWTLLV